MSRTIKNRKTSFWVFVFALRMIFGVSGNAVAQSGGFYIGVSAGVERANIEPLTTPMFQAISCRAGTFITPAIPQVKRVLEADCLSATGLT